MDTIYQLGTRMGPFLHFWLSPGYHRDSGIILLNKYEIIKLIIFLYLSRVREMVPTSILHPLPNGHTFTSWGSLFKGSDSADVEALSDSTTLYADSAIVVNCNDFIGAITFTAKF